MYHIIFLFCQLSIVFSSFCTEEPFVQKKPIVVAQQSTSPFLTRFFNTLNKSRYSFISPEIVDRPNNAEERAQRLHISSVTPIQLMHDDMPAKVNQNGNLPGTQFWIVQKDESYSLRYSNDHDMVNVYFYCKHIPGNNTPLLLFDGNNTNNYSVHAQVDDLQGQSKLYCFPTKGNTMQITQYEGEQFLQKTLPGCVSALTLDNENNVLCCTKKDDGNFFILAKIQQKEKEAPYLQVQAEINAHIPDLKKICPIGNNTYLCLSNTDRLYTIVYNNPSPVGPPFIVSSQKTDLLFKDIAVDPENHNCAFLDTQGNVYTAPVDALHTLEHIYTIDRLKRIFVERISYMAGICSIIYHTGHEDILISGSCEQIKDSALVWQHYTRPFLIGSSIILMAIALLYSKYRA